MLSQRLRRPISPASPLLAIIFCMETMTDKTNEGTCRRLFFRDYVQLGRFLSFAITAGQFSYTLKARGGDPPLHHLGRGGARRKFFDYGAKAETFDAARVSCAN